MKFDKVIEYNITNIFLEKSYTKYGRKFFPSYRNKLKLSYIPITFTSCKAFLKNKTRSGTSLLGSHFLHDF